MKIKLHAMRQKLLDKIFTSGLVMIDLSVALYPGRKFPYSALRRVLRGEGEFTASQMTILKEKLKLTYEELYSLYSEKSDSVIDEDLL